MAGCGEQPAGGRKPNMDKESAHRGSESSDDRSAAPHEESPEYSVKNIQWRKKTVFTEEQSNILESLFEEKPYVTPTEREQLANQLSVSQRIIQIWFQNRRRKVKIQKFDQQASESSDDHSAAPHEENPECSREKKQVRKRTVFTKEQLNTLEDFFKKNLYPSIPEMEQLANQLSLRRLSIKKWFQNRRERVKHPALNFQPESKCHHHTGSKTTTQTHQDLQHTQRMEATIKCVQAQKRSYLDSFPPQRPMDSYALPQGPHSSDMVYRQNVGGPADSCCGTEVCKMPPESGHKPPSDFHFNLPGTSIWIPLSSVPPDLMAYDGPSTSSAPSTSQMPIAPDHADEGSSTDTASLKDDGATDSD